MFHRRKKVRFGMTWWWVNDDSILILGWTISLNVLEKCQIITEMVFLPILRWEMAPEFDWTNIPTLIVHSWFDELSSAWLYLRNTTHFYSIKHRQQIPHRLTCWYLPSCIKSSLKKYQYDSINITLSRGVKTDAPQYRKSTHH